MQMRAHNRRCGNKELNVNRPTYIISGVAEVKAQQQQRKCTTKVRIRLCRIKGDSVGEFAVSD